jgi:hypothetical protein
MMVTNTQASNPRNIASTTYGHGRRQAGRITRSLEPSGQVGNLAADPHLGVERPGVVNDRRSPLARRQRTDVEHHGVVVQPCPVLGHVDEAHVVAEPHRHGPLEVTLVDALATRVDEADGKSVDLRDGLSVEREPNALVPGR